MPWLRSPFTASKANATPSSGATIATNAWTVTSRAPSGLDHEQGQEDRRLAAGPGRQGTDALGRKVERDERRDPEDQQEDVEPHAQQVVRELLRRHR